MAICASTKPGTAPVLDRQALHVPLYKVLLHNDDHNTMVHVVKALMRVFRFDQRRCEKIMLEAHDQGVALCAIEPLEQAELHRDLLRSFSLIVTIKAAE